MFGNRLWGIDTKLITLILTGWWHYAGHCGYVEIMVFDKKKFFSTAAYLLMSALAPYVVLDSLL